ncbi:hypothetical protein M7I_0176 [Glarea lozoyensis 74030]|uniref:Uncharacterized protein n=1 Tax=Glarea lozoyensis (strain ATCC 74030 / MF5533) TaxID=1104152 RepID=H0ECN2_GLAL7|nr:hypothetical protein M7I_0176 [Glarea lozoyensis 74030]
MEARESWCMSVDGSDHLWLVAPEILSRRLIERDMA